MRPDPSLAALFALEDPRDELDPIPWFTEKDATEALERMHAWASTSDPLMRLVWDLLDESQRLNLARVAFEFAPEGFRMTSRAESASNAHRLRERGDVVYELHHDTLDEVYRIRRVEVVGVFESREAARQHMIDTSEQRKRALGRV